MVLSAFVLPIFFKIHKRKNILQIEWSLPQQIIYDYINSITQKERKKKKSAESYTFSFIYRRDGDFKCRTTQGSYNRTTKSSKIC